MQETKKKFGIIITSTNDVNGNRRHLYIYEGEDGEAAASKYRPSDVEAKVAIEVTPKEYRDRVAFLLGVDHLNAEDRDILANGGV